MAVNWPHELLGRIHRRPAHGSDGGFTLIEMMVAIAMATVILTAFAYASTGSVRAVHTARLNQQGADIATQQLERMRSKAFGSLGHDPAGIAPDPHLASGAYQGESLVQVAGGLSPQISTTSMNNATYTTYTYITRPTDVIGADNRRVTVVVEWAAYGRTWSRIMTSVVANTARGLPLPEFKLTPVGPSTVTVNPGATAAFGFQLRNQGAPDQFNVGTTLAGAQIYLDDGNDIFDPTADTLLMTDHNGDGTPDTGRLDPKDQVVFWVVRTVPTGAANATTTWQIEAAASSPGNQEITASLTSMLVVTSDVIGPSATPTPSSSASPSATPSPTGSATPSPTWTWTTNTCPATSPAPVPAAVSGYSRKQYTLHNSGSVSWPTFPLPSSDPILGPVSMYPMYMDMAAPSIPADRELPVLSTDLSPADSAGRLLYTGGSFTSTSRTSTLMFVTQNAARSYTGTVVLRMWVRPENPDDPVRLSAQLLTLKTNNGSISAAGSASPLAIEDYDCQGWQEVWWQFPNVSIAGANKTVLGMKLWNTGPDTVRVAYDHGRFPASLTVVEK